MHITTVQEWLAVNGFVPPGSNFGALPEVLDVELRFAKQHFTADKLAALPPELAATISHNDLTHVEAQQIYKHLEQKDGNGSATNIIGIFHSHALKSWHDLLRSWERDNFHISHAASHLAKKVGVDVQVVTRKLQAAEKAMKTIDSRYVLLPPLPQRLRLPFLSPLLSSWTCLLLSSHPQGSSSSNAHL